MTLPFHDSTVNDKPYSTDNFNYPNFIGYLNKYGQVLDYSYPFGLGGHDNNRMTLFFKQYFQIQPNSPWLNEKDENDYEERLAAKLVKHFKKVIQENIILLEKDHYDLTEAIFLKFENDLNIFFYNCYKAGTFRKGFGQEYSILSVSDFEKSFLSGKYHKLFNETEEEFNNRYKSFLESDYFWYKRNLIYDWFKVVVVQFLHYHLIERCEKGITTSDLTPYETFYNYLLNDFTVHQIPRFVYDNSKNKYVICEHNSLIVSDRELRLKDEIQSIRKLVPLNERYKYFR